MEPKQLTPKEALALLDNATAGLKLDRNEHSYVIQALQVMARLVTESESNEPKEL